MVRFWEGRKIEEEPAKKPLVTVRAHFGSGRVGNVNWTNTGYGDGEGITLTTGTGRSAFYQHLPLTVAEMKSAHKLLGDLIAAYEGEME